MASKRFPFGSARQPKLIPMVVCAVLLTACSSSGPDVLDNELVGAVAGTVTDGSGRPVAGASVQLEVPDYSRNNVLTNADGRYSGEVGGGRRSPGAFPLVVTITPPQGSSLQPATVDDSIALADVLRPPRDTAVVDVVLKP